MGTRRLATKTATELRPPPLYPPAPAETRDGAGFARGAVHCVHARTGTKKKKEKREK